jgi:hypothetical protein
MTIGRITLMHGDLLAQFDAEQFKSRLFDRRVAGTYRCNPYSCRGSRVAVPETLRVRPLHLTRSSGGRSRAAREHGGGAAVARRSQSRVIRDRLRQAGCIPDGRASKLSCRLVRIARQLESEAHHCLCVARKVAR